LSFHNIDGLSDVSFCSIDATTAQQCTQERYEVIICITELYMITMLIMVCCLFVIVNELQRPECGIMDHVDKLRVSLRNNPPELPDTKVYELRALVRIHRDRCRFKLHPETGKCDSATIYTCVIYAHKGIIDDFDWLMERLDMIRNQEEKQYVDKKPSECKRRYEDRKSRYTRVLSETFAY